MKVKSPEQLLSYLVGQVMTKTQGRANPHVVRAMILERLEAAPIEAAP